MLVKDLTNTIVLIFMILFNLVVDLMTIYLILGLAVYNDWPYMMGHDLKKS